MPKVTSDKELIFFNQVFHHDSPFHTISCICLHVQLLRRVQLFVTLWTIARQAPLSMGFSRQEYWSGLPCSPPGGLPNPGTEPVSLISPVLAGRFLTTCTTWEALREKVKSLSHARFFVTPWTVACTKLLPSMGFSRQEYWSGFPFPSPGSSYKGINPSCVSSTLMIYSPSKGPTS